MLSDPGEDLREENRKFMALKHKTEVMLGHLACAVSGLAIGLALGWALTWIAS